jgi:cytochrome c oxidase assembly protein subunit 15
VAPLQLHAWIEFGNRLINAALTVACLGALVAATRRRPHRRDLTLLSAGLTAGLVAEIVLGALVVYAKLAPTLVSLHFLLGLAFLAVAVVLHHRAGLTDSPSAPSPLVGRLPMAAARLMLLLLIVAAALGTIVTSTGPHGGDPKAPRFHLSLHSVAQLHGTAVEAFLAITLFTLWLLARTGAPRPVIRRAQVMLVVLAAQAAVGYTQYLNGDPVALVAAHVAGASLAVVVTLRFYFGLWAHEVGAPDSPSLAPATGAVPVAP